MQRRPARPRPSRREQDRPGDQVRYPQGTIIWFDSYLVPKDAPHPSAHAFINMLRPEVIAAVTNTVNYQWQCRCAVRQQDVLEDRVYPRPM
jgi:putrescine transport system substrate-binding protein